MKSLSARLTAMMLIICVVGMGLITTISTILFRGSLLDESFGKISQSTAKEAARIDGWLENQTSYITALSIELSYEDSFGDEIRPQLSTHVDKNEQYAATYIGMPDGTATFFSGYVPDYAGGWAATQRPWYTGAQSQPGVPFITAPYTDTTTGGLCISISMTVDQAGSIAAVVGTDILIDKLNNIVLETNVGENSYAFLTDADGNLLIHPNEAYGPDGDDVFQSLTTIEGGIYADLWRDTAEDGLPVKGRGADGVTRYYTAETIPSTGWRLYTAIPVSVVEAPIYSMLIAFAIAFVLVLLAAFALIYFAVRRIVVKPISDVTAAAEQLAEGRTDIRIIHNYQDEIGSLIDSFTHMADSIRGQAEATEAIASGDLTIDVPVRSDTDVMGRALQSLQENLVRFIGSISHASDQVSTGSNQISSNSQALAQGATEQAATVQNLVTSIAEVSDKINMNTEKTRATSEVSANIAQNAAQGAEQMNRMTQAVQEINDASTSISKVIKTIDDIAFQTNILALNAAVEAARAGIHGKGFAVVADEVRNLAAKSAQAASETTTLISASITKASEGKRIAEETSKSLRVIIDGVSNTATLAEEINVATEEQSEAIAQINGRIEQVNEVVSANASISEECAAAAAELSGEAVRLAEQVTYFRVEKSAEHPSVQLRSRDPDTGTTAFALSS